MERVGAALTLIVAFGVCGPLQAKEPQKDPSVSATVTCGNPVGTWRNQMGSEMKITGFNPSTGAIQGQYRTSSGATGFYPLVGWVNSAPPTPGSNNAVSMAFTVRWGQIGSITSWTGVCADSSAGAGIRTLWQLSRPNSQFAWDHNVAGADNFSPM